MNNKEEISKRYELLKKNLNFYLLQFVYEDTDKEFEKKNEYRALMGYNRKQNKDIYLKINDYQLTRLVDFMFGCKPDYEIFKSSDFEKVRNGLELLEKKRNQLVETYNEENNIDVLISIISSYLQKSNVNNYVYSIEDYLNIYKEEKKIMKKILKKD